MTPPIEGIVSLSLEIAVPIHVGGSTGRNRIISAVVDTGFEGFLALPSVMAEELSLPYADEERMVMADGRIERIPLHRAAVLWDGVPRSVRVHVVDSETALIGVKLLQGYNLNVDFVEGGRVSILPVGQDS